MMAYRGLEIGVPLECNLSEGSSLTIDLNTSDLKPYAWRLEIKSDDPGELAIHERLNHDGPWSNVGYYVLDGKACTELAVLVVSNEFRIDRGFAKFGATPSAYTGMGVTILVTPDIDISDEDVARLEKDLLALQAHLRDEPQPRPRVWDETFSGLWARLRKKA